MTTNATGQILFSANPADGDTITLNGATLTFRADPCTAYEVLIGGGLSDTRANLLEGGSN